MGGLLLGASLITAFIAGIVALFAPCCITVLLPAYLGSVFRQRRTIFLMTFVFFLGLLVVFLPLGLGFAALGKIFTEFHGTIYIAGGTLLLLLGISILTGKHYSMPFQTHAAQRVTGAASVFMLGVFSGFATTCCAPVLAGVLAFSALSGSMVLGGLYSLVYVLGMVVPLFIAAYFIDETGAMERMKALNRRIKYELLGSTVSITMSEIVAGVMFAAMGAITAYLAATGQLAQHMGFQEDINIFTANLAQRIGENMPWVPWYAIAIAAVAVIAVVAMKAKEEAGQ